MKGNTKARFYLASALILCAGYASAAGVQQMQRFLTGLDRLSAHFEQTLFGSEGLQSMHSSGMLYLQRPRQFRWDYLEPEKQQIVADGRQIWLYDQDLEQVSVQSQDSALQGTPAMLLISGEPLERHFEISEGGRYQGMDWVELRPRGEDSQFTLILLAFMDDRLQIMEMADKFGQTTRLQFFDINPSPVFDDDFFRFERPEDVDMYNQ